MKGPFSLDTETVRSVAPNGNGVYVLTSGKITLVSYVGRGNLAIRLLRHASAGKGDYFYFKRVRSEAEGFRCECEMFHRYGKTHYLDNDIHPARPPGRSDMKLCTLVGCNGEPD